MVLETLYPALSSYFSNPAGLLALAALIPLAIFYLVKREPEERIMPSFMFFSDGEEMTSTKSAFRKLLRNILLILHVLAIIGFAAAFAEPYLDGAGTPESSILVMDQSGSMSGDMDAARGFLQDNIGERNTIIAVDSGSRLIAEDVQPGQARSILDDFESTGTSTDIASGLETAQRYEGEIFVGSDLDQTEDSSDVEDLFREFRAQGRNYEVMDTSRRNSWGIVGLEVGESNTTVEIKNFEARDNTVTISSDNVNREVTIEGRSVRSVTLRSSTGKNTVELSEDGFQKDNTAYFYIPETGNFDVTYIADEENQFMMKAFELIDFTDITYRKPPIQDELNSDMYIVGESDRLLSRTVDAIETDVRSGSALVLFGHQDLESVGFENLPVEDRNGYTNSTVTIAEPVRIEVGQTRIRDVKNTDGERLTANSNGLIRSDYGDGEFLLYNIEDEVFNREFLYPVFWKEITNDMLDRTPVEELNYRTGAEINEERIVTPSGAELSGRTELKETGFYDTSRGPVAVNMLNEDESLRDETDIEPSPATGAGSKASVENLVIAFILLLVLVEMGYLYRIGDIR